MTWELRDPSGATDRSYGEKELDPFGADAGTFATYEIPDERVMVPYGSSYSTGHPNFGYSIDGVRVPVESVVATKTSTARFTLGIEGLPGGPMIDFFPGFLDWADKKNKTITPENYLTLDEEWLTDSLAEAADEPYTDANEDCSIEVKFKGNLSKGTPKFATGPSRTQLGEYTGVFNAGRGDKWPAYEFRFEVTGSVNSGRIGRIGDPTVDSSVRLGNGKWQIGQWKFPFPTTNKNGYVDSDTVGKTTDDSPERLKGKDQTISVKGRKFAWHDMPGFFDTPYNPMVSAELKVNFLVYAQNGDKRCEVAFHIIGSYSNGKWTARIGRGLLRQ